MSALLTPALLAGSRRYLTRHPWQTWLSIIGIALGVSVVIAVDLANESARRGFRLSVEQVTGPATHQIESASGAIAEELYASLRLQHGLRRATPVIDAPVRISGRSMTLLGIDLIAAASMGRGVAAGDPAALLRLLSEPNTLALTTGDAERLGVARGDAIDLDLGAEDRSMVVAAVIPEAQAAGLTGLAIADIATAQEALDRIGEIEHIDLVLKDDQVASLAAALPEGLRLQPAAQRGNALAQMTRAFHINLTAMSLLALLVGAFIVYNTMTFAVLQRRPLLGTLRMLGVTRLQLFALVLTEATILALIGAVLGILGGIAVGAGLVQLVTRTINDIYFQLSVRSLHLAPLSLLKGIGLGLGVTLVAALGPALEAARSQPRDVVRRTLVETRGRRLLPWLAVAGLLIGAAGFLLVQLSMRSMGLGFTALFLVIVGTSLVMPLVVYAFARLTTPLLGRVFGIAGRLAARGITASITRSGLAVAALAVAVAATIGVGIMIGSFRTSVADWLGNTLTSDIYVSAESSEGNRRGTDLPGVEDVSEGRSRRVDTRQGQVTVLALAASGGQPRGFRFKGETADDLWPRWHAGELALISEPYAYHHGTAVGDRIDLFTVQGWRGYEVGGVFQDYSSSTGMLILPRSVYASLWDDPGISTFGVVLTESADAEAIAAEIDQLLAARDIAASVQTNRSIRELSLTVFDRTFTITEVLRLLAIGVAFVGILSALMALELERAKDYAVLRATGMTRRQLRLLILLQTSAMGLAAGLLAMPLGLIMGSLLIDVINVRSFGWTMPLQVSGTTLLSGLLLAWLAAFAAGLYPAQRAARAAPADALREE